MILTLSVILLLAALLCTLGSMMTPSKCPLAVPVLLIVLWALLQTVPKG